MSQTMRTAETGELSTKVATLKNSLADVAATAKTKVIGGTTQWAKENPAAAVGILAGVAGAIGFCVGVYAARKKSN